MAGRGADVDLRRRGVSQKDVVIDGSVEKDRILLYHPDLPKVIAERLVRGAVR